MNEQRLVLIGFGNVGRAFARLLLRKADELTARYDLAPMVVAIATRRHGSLLAPKGIDLSTALDTVEGGGSLASISPEPAPTNPLELIEASQGDVLLENTPVDYDSGQPAIDHLRAALEYGMHAITANKGPVVHGYQQLSQLAAQQGRRFLFEPTVLDGAPLFSLWQEGLPAARLESFRGILNSTTNHVLGQVEAGDSFPQAIAHAQELGIAETDPSGDLEGWDAAIKVAALATVLMGQALLPADVDRHGIQELTEEDVRSALESGQRWKLICQAERTSQGLKAQVRPERVGREDPLFSISGTSSAITFQSDVLGALTVAEEHPGPDTTAYGLLADFLRAILRAQQPG